MSSIGLFIALRVQMTREPWSGGVSDPDIYQNRCSELRWQVLKTLKNLINFVLLVKHVHVLVYLSDLPMNQPTCWSISQICL